ncbi:hypothetical protein PG985_001512 [Apiospora marii]|uniref:Uncharacterized protein n=1 Tax=Apiospora marii TaxID=335849 RepID=A0ABR1RI58_9PEZI
MAVVCYNFNIDKFGTTWTTYTPLSSPCGPLNATTPVLPCCNRGDTCLSDILCHTPDPHEGTSGYYRPGCTDPNFPESACRTQCKDHTWDVVYRPDTEVWACCNDTTTGGAGDCNFPLQGSPLNKEPFRAPAPERLLPYFSIPAEGYNQTTATPLSPSPTGSSAPANTSMMKSQSLSAGASAGIGVGVGLGTALVVLVAGAWFLRRGRKTSSSRHSPAMEQQMHQPPSGNLEGAKLIGGFRRYMSPQELDVSVRPRELQA